MMELQYTVTLYINIVVLQADHSLKVTIIIFTDDRVSLETSLFNPSDRQADSSKRSFVFFLLEIFLAVW